MGRLMGLLFLLFYFLIACKDGQTVPLAFGLHSSGQPPPTSPNPSHLPVAQTESPGVKNTTLLAIAPLSSSSSSSSSSSARPQGNGSPRKGKAVGPMQGPLPSYEGTPVGRAGASEIPSSSGSGECCPCSSTEESPGGWLWGAALAARILSPFLCLCLQPPSFQHWRLLVSFCLGGISSEGKLEKGGQEDFSLQGHEFGYKRCFFFAGTHLPSLGWISTILGYVFGSGP